MFNKVLIANRGEIACRVVQTAKRLGIKTVGLYNDADKDSKHLSMVDEAAYIGSNDLADSYLNQDKILRVAKQFGAECLHPGYGFLSENAGFVQRCHQAGVNFIGPPSSAIQSMGNKSESKTVMTAAGVPLVSGYHGENQDPLHLKAEAAKIGYPVMIKAVLGGGGKGMRTCFQESDFLELLDSAKTEGIKSFDDDQMLVEKFVQKPKHIEVQVIGDKHGNYVHLFERDCSVQRRHQKVIEEAPSFLPHEDRMRIGAAAVSAAEAVGYFNAGTVEFIYDTADGQFYFMEMNTRLQVEHPITEEITEQDLVELQFRVAAGQKLPITQDDLSVKGHAFEARVYAEDPDFNFQPSPGKIHFLREPRSRTSAEPDDYVRVDTGIRQGDEVSSNFDPMISKLIVKGANREEAMDRLKKALDDYKIIGVKNNIAFHKRILESEDFKNWDYGTDFIENNEKFLFEHKYSKQEASERDVFNFAVVSLLEEREQITVDPNNPWMSHDSFRLNYTPIKKFSFTDENGDEHIAETYHSNGQYFIRIGENEAESASFQRIDANTISVTAGDITYNLEYHADEEQISIIDDETKLVSSVKKPVKNYGSAAGAEGAEGAVFSSMPGTVEKVNVAKGDSVEAGQLLVSLISMKNEYVFKAEKAGTIKSVRVQTSQEVPKGHLMVEFEEEAA